MASQSDPVLQSRLEAAVDEIARLRREIETDLHLAPLRAREVFQLLEIRTRDRARLLDPDNGDELRELLEELRAVRRVARSERSLSIPPPSPPASPPPSRR